MILSTKKIKNSNIILDIIYNQKQTGIINFEKLQSITNLSEENIENAVNYLAGKKYLHKDNHNFLNCTPLGKDALNAGTLRDIVDEIRIKRIAIFISIAALILSLCSFFKPNIQNEINKSDISKLKKEILLFKAKK